jgi:hypothetical protein
MPQICRPVMKKTSLDIDAQYLQTDGRIDHVVIELDMDDISGTIRAPILY